MYCHIPILKSQSFLLPFETEATPDEGLLALSKPRQGLLSLATEASGACIHIGETAFAVREWCSM